MPRRALLLLGEEFSSWVGESGHPVAIPVLLDTLTFTRDIYGPTSLDLRGWMGPVTPWNGGAVHLPDPLELEALRAQVGGGS